MGYVIKGPADIVRAPEHAESDIVVLNPEGRPYSLGMVMPDGLDFCYADSAFDLVCALIPEYEDVDISERAYLRIALADLAATIRQAEILVETDPDLVSEGEWATLNAPKTGPLTALAPWWRCSVPLLVVTTSYEPFTSRQRPASSQDGVTPDNLYWVDPHDEESLIQSLHRIGYIRAMENVDFEGVMISGE